MNSQDRFDRENDFTESSGIILFFGHYFLSQPQWFQFDIYMRLVGVLFTYYPDKFFNQYLYYFFSNIKYVSLSMARANIRLSVFKISASKMYLGYEFIFNKLIKWNHRVPWENTEV